MNDHEENIKKEFEMNEGVTEVKSSVVDLGRVENPINTGKISPDDPEIKKLNELTGHLSLDTSEFPSAGRFYRKDFEIHIRPARVGEIRDFSTMDEDNIKDVDDKLNNILVSCCKVMYGKSRGSYRDILEEDRVYVILSIKELTFKDGESKLMMPVKSRECNASACESQKSVELITQNLQFQSVDEKLEKYYDEVDRCYSIQTKKYGVIKMAPPTIGVMRSITEWVRSRETKGQSWDQSDLSIIPYLQREWRGWDDRAIFTTSSSITGWDKGKFSLVYRLAERMRIGIKPEMKFACESCSAEVTVPLTFPGGVKSLFVISDIDSELL